MPNKSVHWPISRRALCAGLAASPFCTGAGAQTPAVSGGLSAIAQFDFGQVVEEARRVAATVYQPPPALKRPSLDYDAYRDVRFRPDRAFLAETGSKFRLQLFATGATGTSPVAVNIVRDGVSRPLSFSSDLFDFGPRVTAPQRAAIDGFAGLRLHYPLNSPDHFDEVIAFLRASYFRFVGRGQRYGQSIRGLAIGAGDPSRSEEFPRFREFWILQPPPGAESIEVMALLDSPSLAGAYHITVRPGRDTIVKVDFRLFARVAVDRLGLAPITSMYFTGESGPRIDDDFRLEVHDASGLLVHSTRDEWTWRPLRNPAVAAVSRYTAPMSGFGLVQRLRDLADYEDLEAEYELRPSYWIEPAFGFDKGAVELVELREQAETEDNVVAQWRPAAALNAGETRDWSYTVSTRNDDPDKGRVAMVAHTLIMRPGADLAGAPPGAQRFFIDFAGAVLAPFLDHPEDLAIVAQVANGHFAANLTRHPEAPLLRARFDVIPDKGVRTDATLYLSWLGRAVTEIWAFPVEG